MYFENHPLHRPDQELYEEYSFRCPECESVNVGRDHNLHGVNICLCLSCGFIGDENNFVIRGS